MNRKFLLMFSLLTVLMVPFIVLVLPIWPLGGAVLTGFYVFATRFLYLRFIKKMKPKYPLVPPGPEQDPYFPRTNIPRPIYKDYREHPEYFEKMKKQKEKE